MSRILEALKKAVPLPRPGDPAAPSPPKPLIFEKISFEPPSPDAVRREIERKKEEARRRYVLNEQPHTGPNAEKRNVLGVLAALLAAGLIAVWLWPHPAPVPAGLAEENVRLHETIAGLENRLADRQAEIDRLNAEAAQPKPVDDAPMESLRADVRRLNRQLAVMLQDNLEKDREIERLSGR